MKADIHVHRSNMCIHDLNEMMCDHFVPPTVVDTQLNIC